MFLTILFDVVAAIGLGLALVVAFRIQKNLLGHPGRIFLSLFIGLYFLVSIANILRHGGIADFLDRYEYLAELLFPPIFLFFVFPIFSLFIFSAFMKHDMYRRIRAEELLKRSERKFRNLSEEMADGVAVVREGRILWANRSFGAIFGYREEESLLGVEFDSLLVGGADKGASFSPDQLEQRNGPLDRLEIHGKKADGTIFHAEVSQKKIDFDDKPALQAIVRDISERKCAEAALKRAKEEWERTFHTVPDLIAILDEKRRIVRVNKAMADRLGVSPRALVGLDFNEAVHGKSASGTEEPRGECIPGDQIQSMEIHDEKSNTHFLESVSTLRDEEDRVLGFVRVARDISELKRVQKELDKTRSFLQSIIDGVTDTIMVIDKEYGVLLMNKALGVGQAVPSVPFAGTRCHHVTHRREVPCRGDEHPCPLLEVIGTGNPVTVLHRHFRHDDTEHMVEIAASPFFDDRGEIAGIIEVGRDVTEKLRLEEERKKLESRLFQQQKDKSIANLAAGMAHDFNNMLATVTANAELLMMNEEAGREDRRMLAAIEKAAMRMVALTNQLLAYAKEGAYQSKSIRFDEAMEEALQIAAAGAVETTKVETRIAGDLWPVLADPNQMRQMLVNIFTNGFEAMKGKGVLTVVAENHTMKEDWECPMHACHPGGDYIHISIADMGTGIPPQVEGKIFEPFVSSKAFGRGLGLPAALGIAHNHGGCILIQDMKAKGVTCHIYLPREKERMKDDGPPHAGGDSDALVN